MNANNLRARAADAINDENVSRDQLQELLKLTIEALTKAEKTVQALEDELGRQLREQAARNGRQAPRRRVVRTAPRPGTRVQGPPMVTGGTIGVEAPTTNDHWRTRRLRG